MEGIRQRIEKITDTWGICPFEGIPLLPVRSRKRLPEGAKSIIVLLFGYYTEEYPQRNIARYAVADDYHTILLPKLQGLADELAEAFPGEAFVPFIDASPIAEVEAACRAGLGQPGRNGLLINPCYGSYCFIGEVVTTALLDRGTLKGPALCIGCDACIRACPTGALSEKGFCLEKCRSYITQKKGELADWESQEIRLGGKVWGCDCCVDACPRNRQARQSRVPEFYENREPVLTLEVVEKLYPVKAYGWRGQKVLYRNLSLLGNNKKNKNDK